MNRYLRTVPCPCGKVHEAAIKDIIIGPGVLAKLPEAVRSLHGSRPFLLSDPNTWKAAGKAAASFLDECGIPYVSHTFTESRPAPNEFSVGNAVMHFDRSCDIVIGIGSGVINDICKILSNISGLPYIIVATAPSMDGYASATSSMEIDGLKVSLPTRCADIIIGDTDILKAAPKHMISSGIGDMIAKYISIAEWRISHLITGEYYCEQIAQMIRGALKRCVDCSDTLLQGDPDAAAAVFEGLIIGGIAMAYAGISRPASGVEHYFSHVWDMRALQFNTFSDLHGIQCAAAALTAVRLYQVIKTTTPDKEKAFSYVEQFDYEKWKDELRSFLGRSADTMIELEQKEGKYRKDTHPARFAIICSRWNEILKILDEELPDEAFLEGLLTRLHIPVSLTALHVDPECAKMTFRASKDIRDKYVLSRLAWDLGILEELCCKLDDM